MCYNFLWKVGNYMNKESTIPTAIAFIGFICVAVFCFFIIKDNVVKKSEEKRNQETQEVGKLDDIRININGVSYTAVSESTKAAESFLTHLPLEIEMTDLNENEKRGYTYFKLTTEARKLGKIEIGDILLSGDSYVIIATKTFKSSQKYTKIGHIQNLGNVPNGTIKTFISKIE